MAAKNPIARLARRSSSDRESSSRKVFLSYRRAEDGGYAGRLYDDLTAALGRGLVFRDIDALEPGSSFVHQLQSAIEVSSVVIVVIGPRWSQALDASGNRRLDRPDDYVRQEIRLALEHQLPVIPVLV